MNKFPEIGSYGKRLANHPTTFVEVDGLKVWYSYATPVAFETVKTGLVVRDNVWGSQTGKHLNLIDPQRRRRVGEEIFEYLWESVHKDPCEKQIQ